MQIDLAGRTARIEGAMGPIATRLQDWLVHSGATIRANSVPDLLVLSAPLLEGEIFDWEGLARTARSLGAAMKTRGSGRILFLLSASATLPVRRQADLSMQTAALHVLMRSLAMSLAPEIAVNALGAGAIAAETGELVSGDAAMIGHASVGRAGQIEEACHVALFLCDPDNSYLTGQLLSADGGWAAGYGRNF